MLYVFKVTIFVAAAERPPPPSNIAVRVRNKCEPHNRDFCPLALPLGTRLAILRTGGCSSGEKKNDCWTRVTPFLRPYHPLGPGGGRGGEASGGKGREQTQGVVKGGGGVRNFSKPHAGREPAGGRLGLGSARPNQATPFESPAELRPRRMAQG